MARDLIESLTIKGARNRHLAASLAFLSAFQPTPWPIAGLHKFYLGQPRWGVLYVLLAWTQIPRVASAIEGVWYLFQGDRSFEDRFRPDSVSPLAPHSAQSAPTTEAISPIDIIATALRELEQLRQEGLVSEYEFEQKRRSLLDKIT